MQKRIVEIVACDNCKFEFVRVEEDMKGNRVAVFPNDLALRVGDEKKMMFAKCRRCGHETARPAEFWLRFNA